MNAASIASRLHSHTIMPQNASSSQGILSFKFRNLIRHERIRPTDSVDEMAHRGIANFPFRPFSQTDRGQMIEIHFVQPEYETAKFDNRSDRKKFGCDQRETVAGKGDQTIVPHNAGFESGTSFFYWNVQFLL
ncbi:hypothetical protein ACF3MZ_16835 [Paenibacillaceae bacterium WGS1546]|uniref:hypothetical protein n=1 Tax=Cohnella sp. WGS1546 TaxID=3366810 RepID=UPI00372D4962